MPKWYAKPNLCMVSFARPHGSTSSDDGGGDDGGETPERMQIVDREWREEGCCPKTLRGD